MWFMSFERWLKSIHGWLGFVVMPWVIVIGFTGFYLNHAQWVTGLLNGPVYDETQFDAWPDPAPLDQKQALVLAQSVWPGANFRLSSTTIYHSRPVWYFKANGDHVVVSRATGHYWVKTANHRLTYDPTGRLLHSKRYWGSLFKNLHVNGWIDSTLGSWLADLTAGAMVLFGLSGIILFLNPRLRRRRNRQARQRAPEPVN